LAGFEVKTSTDDRSHRYGRENLEDLVQLIVFVGDSLNSDVLGSAKGGQAAFLYKFESKGKRWDNFYAREDT